MHLWNCVKDSLVEAVVFILKYSVHWMSTQGEHITFVLSRIVSIELKLFSVLFICQFFSLWIEGIPSSCRHPPRTFWNWHHYQRSKASAWNIKWHIHLQCLLNIKSTEENSYNVSILVFWATMSQWNHFFWSVINILSHCALSHSDIIFIYLSVDTSSCVPIVVPKLRTSERPAEYSQV